MVDVLLLYVRVYQILFLSGLPVGVFPEAVVACLSLRRGRGDRGRLGKLLGLAYAKCSNSNGWQSFAQTAERRALFVAAVVPSPEQDPQGHFAAAAGTSCLHPDGDQRRSGGREGDVAWKGYGAAGGAVREAGPERSACIRGTQRGGKGGRVS